jgi:hypothetical protein
LEYSSYWTVSQKVSFKILISRDDLNAVVWADLLRVEDVLLKAIENGYVPRELSCSGNICMKMVAHNRGEGRSSRVVVQLDKSESVVGETRGIGHVFCRSIKPKDISLRSCAQVRRAHRAIIDCILSMDKCNLLSARAGDWKNRTNATKTMIRQIISLTASTSRCRALSNLKFCSKSYK